ncbi:MAG TPA: malto-oligosyltrehalose trehalohydrolase [Polyangiales bacterium]|nr:malto-oligosyltrehalose trehalohydrolase [Polyangiales bacterium]
MKQLHVRNMPIGAECRANAPSGVHFRVWAPRKRSVQLVLDGRERLELQPEADGYWSLLVDTAQAGTRYHYAFDGSAQLHPDPASRFQPDGPDGASEVVDPLAYRWNDASWRGSELAGQVIYELHIGTFTREGTWAAARAKLPHLRELGVTTIELMPLSEFPGRFGWGYDGVLPYAPYHAYGRPDELRAFVDAAHGVGLGVLLDVVYNHLGPAGDHLPAFASSYFSDRSTEWGSALNFDGADSRPVRDYVCENAAYWIREYHLDGLRLDATQSIYDTSQDHILAELGRRTRAAAGERSVVLIAENEPQDTQLVRPPAEGGFGLDAIWNDDFHHSATVALLGRREAYYTDYLGRAHEFVAALLRGPLYQGQYYVWQKKRRGSLSRGVPRRSFVAYLENHDQVANSARGERVWRQSRAASHRALTSLLLLGPWTPLLFQGQEWSSAAPFLFFADHAEELAAAVRRGRGEFLAQFPSYASRAVQEQLAEPAAQSTFTASKLDWDTDFSSERAQQSLALHRDLLQLRHGDALLRAANAGSAALDAAVLSDTCLALRVSAPDGAERLLIVNLANELELRPAPEPLLAPPAGGRWQLRWSSEALRYGGNGVPDAPLDERGWQLPGPAALWFESVEE